MPRLTKEQQAQRRARILDAAELCFAGAGFHRTTMQDICKRAGVSAGAVYVYFDSKEDLIDGIVARNREDLTRDLGAVAGSPDLLEGLRGALRSCVLEKPPHHIALFVEMVAESHRNARVAAAMATCDCAVSGMLADLMTRAQAQGRIAASIDAGALAEILTLVGDGMMLRQHGGLTFDVERTVPALLDMVGSYMMRGAAVQDFTASASGDGGAEQLRVAE